MIEIPRAMERVRELVPDLDAKIGQFEIGEIEIDDELIEVFYEELARLSDDLQAGFDAANNEKVREASHSMKGMAGTMGLPEISVLAREIEMAVRADDLDSAKKFGAELVAWARDFCAQQ